MTDGPHDRDPERTEGGYPPAEALVAAFRKALRNGVKSDSETDRSAATPEQQDTSSLPTESPDVGPWHTTKSREAWAKETLAAFRKAAETVWGPNREDENPSVEEKSADETAASDRPDAHPSEIPEWQKEEETEAVPDDSSSGTAEGPEDPEAEAAALALAFRRAFFKRRVRHDPRSEGPERAALDHATRTTTALPPRPNPSFLWVTDDPHDSAAAVGPDSLSGERARDAEAFLLQGEGAEPCRLLRRIRQHSEARVFLKPVFWRRVDGQTSLVADHVDGVWTPQSSADDLRALRERATAINQRIRDVGEAEEGADISAERRVVQFVATRADEFAPRGPTEDGGALLYPKLTPLLPPNDP